MKRFWTILPALLLLIPLLGQGKKSPQEKYIDKYSAIAVNEMYRSGVPASITLAQGIVESSSGTSELAVKGNNHFGIKCHKTWKGKKMYYDDDLKGECFRKYPSAEDSFRDHSDFLRYRDRYKFLFDLPTTDYEGWAAGLKKAGYATDPGYASKLIRCIETYDLSRFDLMGVEETFEAGGLYAVRPETVQAVEEIPASPLSLEQGTLSWDGPVEQFSFSLERKMYSCNGVPYVLSEEGETYASIATANHLFLKEILRYNDLSATQSLAPGTRVYLQQKKKYSREGLDKYIVDADGESVRDICQRFGIRQKTFLKLNGLPYSYIPAEGDELLLRPEPKKR